MILEMINSVTAEKHTADYYGQWMQRIIQSYIDMNSVGIPVELPKVVKEFMECIDHKGQTE